LNVMESEVGVIRIQIEAGQAGAEVWPYTKIHEADVSVADEAKSKKSAVISYLLKLMLIL
jgi:hypothetical protein